MCGTLINSLFLAKTCFPISWGPKSKNYNNNFRQKFFKILKYLQTSPCTSLHWLYLCQQLLFAVAQMATSLASVSFSLLGATEAISCMIGVLRHAQFDAKQPATGQHSSLKAFWENNMALSISS